MNQKKTPKTTKKKRKEGDLSLTKNSYKNYQKNKILADKGGVIFLRRDKTEYTKNK